MKEQEELHRNLGTANSVSHKQQAVEDAAGLRSLLEQGDLLEEEMKKEKQARMDLEKEVKKCALGFGHRFFWRLPCATDVGSVFSLLLLEFHQIYNQKT